MMPELYLGNPEGKEGVRFLESNLLMSVMYFPNNPETRKHYMACHAALARSEGFEDVKNSHLTGFITKEIYGIKIQEKKNNPINISKEEIAKSYAMSGGESTLLNAPALDDIREKTKLSFNRGFNAFRIFHTIWRLSKAKIRGGASVNKAIHIMESSRAGKDSHLKNISFNSKSLRQDWAEYKNVAHLWVPYFFYIAHYRFREYSPHFMPGLSNFLSIAEAFREFGENHFPRGRKEPTLNPAETWYPAKDFPLLCEVKLDPPPLSQEELNALQDYRAPQKL
jgi:hypothetical protein